MISLTDPIILLISQQLFICNTILTMEKQQKMYGWYSRIQQTEIGHCYHYRSSLGEIIQVTEVSRHAASKPAFYPDMYLVGEIRELIETEPNDFIGYIGLKLSKLFKW